MQVHRVGHRAAELAGTPRVFEATMNRDHIKRLMSMMPREDDARTPTTARPRRTSTTWASPEAELTTTVDVREYAEHKRAAMAAHASQIPADSFFLQMPPEVVPRSVRLGVVHPPRRPQGIHEHTLFETLDQP